MKNADWSYSDDLDRLTAMLLMLPFFLCLSYNSLLTS